jgi:Protein of unknown function (DUF2628)
MAIYAVFEPPVRDEEHVDYAERFAFVRDGFSWAAFLFGPFWMLRHLLIGELIGWTILVVAIAILARLVPLPSDTIWLVLVLLAILVGLEAATLRQWALRRRGWHEAGIVAADDLEAAERRFFDGWVAGDGAMTALTPARSRLAGTRAPHGSDVIGLFPEPGVNR